MSPIPLIKIILLLAFMVGCCLTGLVKEDQSFPLKRLKRNLWQFGNMISCATGRSRWDYNGYGCWCGRGGSGTPVDGTDRYLTEASIRQVPSFSLLLGTPSQFYTSRCCRTHDECYDRALRRGCNPYWETYTRSNCTDCASSNNVCEKLVCECDGAAARCFARSNYNSNYKGYRKHHHC
ncbi:basic phospholipase A2 DE-1-like [Orbicella faveolata]|uniref:basic phospholipase A2 DE-1-like n=1 Tax=Orbicella faveolata TaxID=48498 RepID=UPI0009E1D2BB|nr:basic phospholipase A2 DE-1-like [Orbicella faveolata]